MVQSPCSQQLLVRMVQFQGKAKLFNAIVVEEVTIITDRGIVLRDSARVSRKSKWQLTSGPEDNSAVRRFCEGLLLIDFKTLIRPTHHDRQNRSIKELRWGLRVFIGSSMCFFRDLLRSYLALRDSNLEAVSFLAIRAMYETICGAHYINGEYISHVRAGEFEEVWKVLNKVLTGTKVLKYHQQIDPETTLKIGETVNSLDSLSPNEPKGSSYALYRHLSEFSHPDALAFTHYCQMDKNPNRVAFFTEPEPDQGFLRHTVGTLILISGIVYGNLFRTADLHTPERHLDKLIAQFRETESKYPKPILRSCAG